jgi:Ca2+-binding EF-hand superfamily protein
MFTRKTVLIVAGALLTVGAVAAISAPGGRGDRMGGPMLGGWGDMGKGRWARQPMTEEEFDANTRARFARLDRNGDGVVDAAEVEAALAQRAARHKGERKGGQRLLRRFDADRDGTATRDEFMKSVADHFAQLDLNNDGRITDDDLPPAMRGRGVLTGNADGPRRGLGRRALGLLREADADKDGVVTREEMVAAAERRFAGLDRNKDGKLDAGDADMLRRETADYRVQRFFHRFGASPDARVTKDQFYTKAKERFARLDRDSDGTITRGERWWQKGHRWHERGGRGREEPVEPGADPAKRSR